MADFEALVQKLDQTDTVTIVTTRRDGTRVPTYIWAVLADGVPYVRSAYGPDSLWYRRSLNNPLVAFDVGAPDGFGSSFPPDSFTDLTEVRVEHVPDDDEHAAIHALIDHAVTEKYQQRPQSIVLMKEPIARACTLRVVRP